MKNLFILFVLFVTCAFGQNTQVVFDFDALNRPVAKVMPFELVKSGDTTLILGAQYGLENNQERFRFSFTVQAENQMFYKTSEHTFLLIIGENGQGKVASLEDLTYQANSTHLRFRFSLLVTLAMKTMILVCSEWAQSSRSSFISFRKWI